LAESPPIDDVPTASNCLERVTYDWLTRVTSVSCRNQLLTTNQYWRETPIISTIVSARAGSSLGVADICQWSRSSDQSARVLAL